MPDISDEAVRARTGRSWKSWFTLLDKAGGRKMTHQEIVAVAARNGAGPWWRQMITVNYEQDRGLRQRHERPDGYRISRSRTLPVPVEAVYDAWSDARRRSRWLGAGGLKVRTAIENQSLRITWKDGETSVQVSFHDKGGTKSSVVVEHSRLPNLKQSETMKTWWSGALDRLAVAVKS
jgi:uncharacterized protein YndB with AHSA1/START domain